MPSSGIDDADEVPAEAAVVPPGARPAPGPPRRALGRRLELGVDLVDEVGPGGAGDATAATREHQRDDPVPRGGGPGATRGLRRELSV